MTAFSFRSLSSLRDIAPEDWDACANPKISLPASDLAQCPDSNSQTPGFSPTLESFSQEESFNPFLSHAFLSALEESGCADARTGWAPAHLAMERAGELVAVAPAYLKSHSMGEYVFDHAWADAYERAGGAYYPKLQVCVPFTPAPGRRLLVRPDAPADARSTLIAGLRALARKAGASSLHVAFPTEAEWRALGQAGLLQRTGQQFHFSNPGYGSFEDFLAALASRKRKAIRKERAAALAGGVEIEWATGASLSEAHWDAFYTFYMDTGARKWGRPYLNRLFFSLLGERLADRVLLVMARREGRYIAGALNLIGDRALYGRNWGAIEERPFLHFELCYYQAIDFAIQRGLARVEAGAQGEHKLARGYLPTQTYSAHDFVDPRLGRAVADFLAHERRQVTETIEVYGEYAPFKKGS